MESKDLFFLYYSPKAKTYNPVSISIQTDEVRRWLLDVPRSEVVCLDVETTGLDPDGTDEVLQVSMCDGDGEMLLDSYVRPEKRRRWPNAQRIHGISWQTVKDAPTLSELSEQITSILGNCTLVIGYNVRSFDLSFLDAGGVKLPHGMKVYDLINDCSVLYGEWSERYHNYKYVSLESVASRLGIQYAAHSSSEDVLATVKVFYKVLDSREMQSAVRSHKSTEQVLKDADKAIRKSSAALARVGAQPTRGVQKTRPAHQTGCLGVAVIVVSVSVLLVLLAALFVR